MTAALRATDDIHSMVMKRPMRCELSCSSVCAERAMQAQRAPADPGWTPPAHKHPALPQTQPPQADLALNQGRKIFFQRIIEDKLTKNASHYKERQTHRCSPATWYDPETVCVGCAAAGGAKSSVGSRRAAFKAGHLALHGELCAARRNHVLMPCAACLFFKDTELFYC